MCFCAQYTSPVPVPICRHCSNIWNKRRKYSHIIKICTTSITVAIKWSNGTISFALANKWYWSSKIWIRDSMFYTWKIFRREKYSALFHSSTRFFLTALLEHFGTLLIHVLTLTGLYGERFASWELRRDCIFIWSLVMVIQLFSGPRALSYTAMSHQNFISDACCTEKTRRVSH